MNQQLRTAAKWFCVEAVALALWWFGPGISHEDVPYKIMMLGVMHTYLIAILATRGADPCHEWWRNRREGRSDSAS